MIYLSAHHYYTEEVLDCDLEMWNLNFRTHLPANSCPVCVKYQDDEGGKGRRV